jgi:DnaJ-class molecular chaperone
MTDEADQRATDEMAPGDEVPPDTASAGEDLCERCGGSGEADGQTCPACGGSGKVVDAIGGG